MVGGFVMKHEVYTNTRLGILYLNTFYRIIVMPFDLKKQLFITTSRVIGPVSGFFPRAPSLLKSKIEPTFCFSCLFLLLITLITSFVLRLKLRLRLINTSSR